MNAPTTIEPRDVPGNAAASIAFGGIGGGALRTLLQLVMKRLYWAIGAILLCMAGAIFYLMTTPPSFRAVSTLEISRDAREQGPSATGEFRSGIVQDQEFYETQYGLLRGPALAREVVRKLKLVNNPKFMAPPPADKPLTALDVRARETGAMGKVMGNLQVVPARQSRLVEIRYTDGDPKLAAQIVNAVADEFIRSNLDRRVQRTDYARNFLAEAIAETRTKLEEQERRLIDYAADARIVTVPLSGGNDKTEGASQIAGQSLAGAELQAISDELAKARAARAEAQGKLASIRASGTRPEVLNNNAVAGLQQRRAENLAEVAKLSVSFDDNYPPLVAARNEAAAIDRQIRQITQQVSSSLEADYRAATDRERLIQAKVDSLKNEMIDLSRKSIQYNIIQRDVDTSRTQYESLLQRLKDVSVANDVGSSNVSIIMRGEPPLGKSAPLARPTMMIGFALGLILAVILVVGLELLDTSFSSPESVQSALNVPLVGVIPEAKSSEPVEDLADRKSPFSEAYVSTLANLRFTTGQGAPHAIAITSTQASEGKSTTAMSLASLFARQGESVVLVDSDMRKPSLHKRLDLPNTKGFSNLLAGDNDIDSIVCHSDKIGGLENLAMITAGPHPPSPAELLSGERLGEVIEMLRQKYTRVIVDAPPVLGLADSPLISQSVDGVVYVIESNRTRIGAVRRAMDRVRDLRGNVVGVILTKYDIRRSRFSEYGYDSYDYYSYGSKRSKRAES